MQDRAQIEQTIFNNIMVVKSRVYELFSALLGAETLSDLIRIKKEILSAIKQGKVLTTQDFNNLITVVYAESLEMTDDLLKQDLKLPISIAFNKPHKEAISLLSKITRNDIAKAYDSYNNTVASYISRISISVEAKTKLVTMLEKGTFVEGQSIGDVSKQLRQVMREHVQTGYVLTGSRRYKFDDYMKILARVVPRAVQSRATELRCLQNGVNHVMISFHGATDWCRVYENKVFSLVENDPYGFPSLRSIVNGGTPFHPNCRHVELPFVVSMYEDKLDEYRVNTKWVTRDTKYLYHETKK